MASPGVEQRRDKRYPVQISVTLFSGKNETSLLTEDVGFRGVFLRTDAPPPLRHLLRLRMILPPDDRIVVVHGMAVHRVMPGTPGRAPGVGVQFYGIDRAAQSSWDEFIAQIQRSAATSFRLPPTAVDSVRRQHPRYRAELAVALQTMDDLHSLISRDVSKGGMFVQTDLDLPVGSDVLLHIPHPRSAGVFSLAAVVRRRETGPRPGIGVEFTDLDPLRKQAFHDFIRDQLEVIEEAELLDDSDIEVLEDPTPLAS